MEFSQTLQLSKLNEIVLKKLPINIYFPFLDKDLYQKKKEDIKGQLISKQNCRALTSPKNKQNALRIRLDSFVSISTDLFSYKNT